VLLAQLDQTIKDRLPFLVAREIVVGDEKLVDAVFPVESHELLNVIGRPVARFAALYVDDRAERTLVGAAAAGIEARAQSERADHMLFGQIGMGMPCIPVGNAISAIMGHWSRIDDLPRRGRHPRDQYFATTGPPQLNG